MIDLKHLRLHAEDVKTLLKRKSKIDIIDQILNLDEERREQQHLRDEKRAQINLLNKKIAQERKNDNLSKELLKNAKALSSEIKEYEKTLSEITEQIKNLLLKIPNIPEENLPQKDTVIKYVGEKPSFKTEPIPHYEIGEILDILDLKFAADFAGSRFMALKGMGARLNRALINFFLDFHSEEGFIEVEPPFLGNYKAILASGELPHMKEDMYYIEKDNLYLIPTAEPALINLHANQILNENRLPLKYVAYTPCFRREAGAYGKDVKGIKRVHQFDKVEMVSFTREENSQEMLEYMVERASKLLSLLGLHHRIVLLSPKEQAFQSAKTYDIEVYTPVNDEYLEVSSVSNCKSFQALRNKTRYKTKEGNIKYTHILNGSGLALPRTLIAIMENFQTPDGKIKIPEVLVPYINKETIP